jgi:hypothetical protein
MLREDNVRVGVFEHEQYEAVLAHLPEAMRPVVTFAYVPAGESAARCCAPVTAGGSTHGRGPTRSRHHEGSRREGFYLTPDLLQLLKQRSLADEIQRQRKMIVQHVFFNRSVSLNVLRPTNLRHSRMQDALNLLLRPVELRLTVVPSRLRFTAVPPAARCLSLVQSRQLRRACNGVQDAAATAAFSATVAL